MTSRFDIAVVGAGVVGCALARHLTLAGAKVLVLEKAHDVLDGASKGNSAILHTGFDAPVNSLEQHCLASGYAEYLKIADTLGLPILKSGAMILAWNETQLEQLPSLVQKAHQNGVYDVALLSRDEIIAREPHVSNDVLGGIEVPGEYLIDPWASAHAYLLQAIENGAEVFRGTEVLGGSFNEDCWQLNTSQGDYYTKCVVNCAGLYGDVVDERILGKSTFAIKPRKGQFLVFDKAASQLVSSIILPVPTKTTKGIVVCRTVFGNLLVGPTAEEQESRTKASTNKETLSSLRERAIEMFPVLEQCEITTAYAGLRPATEFTDYQIRHEESKNYICVGGIRSTGLSGALGIAKYVAEKLDADIYSGQSLSEPIICEPDRLSDYHTRDWQLPDNGGIICHCELVTRREIEKAMSGPLPPRTLQGLKRRTRVCMGRCQGFYCMGALAEITNGKLAPPLGVKHAKE